MKSEPLVNGKRQLRQLRVLKRLSTLRSDANMDEPAVIQDDAPPQTLIPADPPAPTAPARIPLPARPVRPVHPPEPEPEPVEPIRRPRRFAARREVAETPFDRYLIGSAMIAVALVLWAIGASHSLDGWVIAINAAAEVAGLPIKIEPIVGADRFLLIPLGVVYTVAEFRLRLPSWRAFWLSPAHALSVIAFALLVHGSDVGSTFVYAIRPPEDAWGVHVAAANNWALALGYAFFLTYIPELMARQGWKRLGRDDEQFDD